VKTSSNGGLRLHRPGATQEDLTISPDEDAILVAKSPEMLEVMKGYMSQHGPYRPYKNLPETLCICVWCERARKILKDIEGK
jgi:hypothetical protein